MKDMKQIQDIDLSKLNFDGQGDQCYREMADLILKNKQLKTINLQKVNAND